MEVKLLAVFSLALLACVGLGWSVLFALGFGFCLFFGYGLKKGHSVGEMGHMALNGVKTVKNILITFLLIGMITAVWRACGTIPCIVYHAAGLCSPSAMVLMTFLLCGLISVLTGTAFGTAATMGVICATMAAGMGVSPVYTGGAVLAGCYFGDRCSPMSTSALLVSSLTGTDIFRNIGEMIRTSWVPFLASCGIYLVMGLNSSGQAGGGQVRELFARQFSLHPAAVIPAAVIVLFSLLRIHVKLTMGVSILCGGAAAVLLQGISPAALPELLVLGFHPDDPELAAVLSGGGIVSMVRTIAIVCLSSSYAGMFDGTGFLAGIRQGFRQLGDRLTPFGGILAASVVSGMVACNQTLSIMLTYQMCRDVERDPERMASHLENTVVVIAALVPWSIAGAVPLTSVGAPFTGMLAACYLYLLPLWNLMVNLRKGGRN